MNVGKNLDEILRYLIENPQLINVNAYTIQKTILKNKVSLLEAKDLFELITRSGQVKVYNTRYIGKSIASENFLQNGGFQKLFPVEHSEVKITASDSSLSIFLSYCWKQSAAAEKIFMDLSQAGVNVKKDDHQLSYRDSIHDYMGSIRKDDFAVVLISDDFLRSKNCMNEMMNLFKEENAANRILPVLIEGTAIYRPKDRAVYLKYWEQELKNLQQEIADIPPYKSLSLHDEVKTVTEISIMIDGFLSMLVKEKNIYLGDLQANGYKELYQKIGVENLSYAIDLFRISFMSDIEERELALNEYISKYPANDFYWGIMAGTAKMSKRNKLAKEYYLKSINISSTNIASYNNLGMLYLFEPEVKDLAEAKKCFERTVELEEKFTIGRLNLGITLSRLGEETAAFEQYKFILSYDPLNAQAHCNIANHHRHVCRDFEKAEEHYKIALQSDPLLLETYLNYGNLLKTTGRLEEGNNIYRRLLALDIGKDLKIAVEGLLKSNKG